MAAIYLFIIYHTMYSLIGQNLTIITPLYDDYTLWDVSYLCKFKHLILPNAFFYEKHNFIPHLHSLYKCH